MPTPVPVRALFESHLTVLDLDKSIAFYRDVVGLEVAYEAKAIGAAFLWIGGRGRSMLGLWARGASPLGLSLHIAGWMPAAAVYFHDPDGHLLEYIAMLEEPPAPDRDIVAWSRWRSDARP